MNKHLLFRILVISCATAFVWYTFPFLYRFYLIALPAAGLYYILSKFNFFSGEKEPYVKPEDQTWQYRLFNHITSFLTEFGFVLRKAFPIIGIVAIVLVIGLYVVSDMLKEKRTNSELAEIATEISIFNSNNGKLPENLEEVIGRNPLKSNWRTDFWGNPIQYSKTSFGQTYTLVSPGKDGIFKTEDDLVSKQN